MSSSTDPELWRTLVQDLSIAPSANNMAPVVRSLYQMISDGNIGQIDFAFLLPEITNGPMLCVALRATRPWKDHIPSWAKGLEVAREALTNQGHDAKSATAGL